MIEELTPELGHLGEDLKVGERAMTSVALGASEGTFDGAADGLASIVQGGALRVGQRQLAAIDHPTPAALGSAQVPPAHPAAQGASRTVEDRRGFGEGELHLVVLG